MLFVIIAVIVAYFLCAPPVYFDKSVEVTAGQGDKIVVLGAETVNIKGTSDDYFRIVSGDSQLYGLPVTDTKFENSGQLSTLEPLLVTHGRADYTISSDNLMKVTKNQSTEVSIFLIICDAIILFLLSLLLWFT
jgi:hypothetical protein